MKPGEKHSNGSVRWYGKGIPYLKDFSPKGKLIVIEGPDSSGRSTQISLLTTQLEADGHAVLNTGLKRSELIGEGILEAKRNASLGKKTLALFYAADFADQLEQKIIPALEAGYIVLADRYIYTLMARNTVRDIPRKWSHDLYGFALVPDLVYYLKVDPYTLVHRVFEKNFSLDYYESGADMGLSDDMFESFILYQQKIAKEFQTMQKMYGLVLIDGDKGVEEINADLKKKTDIFLKAKR
jgi:dTMP kinase